MIRAVSYGGGVQSTALLVLAARRVIDFPLFLMANVGDDSEDPRTLDYVSDIAAPYAAKHGIELVVLRKTKRDGTTESVLSRITKEGSNRIGIPVRMSNGAPAGRQCTQDFKVNVVAKELKRRGATVSEPAMVGIGISRDEIMRANSRSTIGWERIVYPLIGMGEETGLLMDRQDCMNLIASEDLPVPPKSSCFFCPFHRPAAWVELRRERPDLFAKSVSLEETINSRRAARGVEPVFLTRFGMPLSEAIGKPESLLPLFDESAGACDSGWCFT